MRIARALSALVAVLFGVLTIFAGGRVLLGADPGYVVFLPLLVFNTVMGVAYVGAGILIWRSPASGRLVAGAVFVVNLVVLGTILAAGVGGTAVAEESVAAMTLRTVVWLALFVVASWLAVRE